MLTKFKINTKRDMLVPDFACYQMSLTGPVEAAIASGQVSDDFRELPSWSKFAAYPDKSAGFFTRVLDALFKGQGGFDELNVKYQTGQRGVRVAMMFVSAHNDQMEQIDGIASETLDAWRIVTLCGGLTYNGKKINQRNSEKIVREVVELASSEKKSVLIISNLMAQRSFSIPEITELYLAYDNGAMGATLQKMSRALTPGEQGKVGRIFSLSFDPNRDDKFDSMILETAINYNRRSKKKDLREALRQVLRTIDVFTCTAEGPVLVADEYLEAALARKSVSRVLGKRINLTHCSNEVIAAIAAGNGDYLRNEAQDRVAKGKTRESQKKMKKGEIKTPADAKLFAKAREVLVNILENLDVIIYGTDETVLAKAMEVIRDDADMRGCVEEEFGVDFEVLAYIFDAGIINQSYAELMHNA